MAPPPPVCHVPSPRQRGASLDFLTEQVNALLTRPRCRRVLVLGDLNQHMEGVANDHPLTVHGLAHRVPFPSHERGATLGLGLGEGRYTCHQLVPVGSPDHHVILTRANVGVARDDPTFHTICLWGRADWPGLKRPAPPLRRYRKW